MVLVHSILLLVATGCAPVPFEAEKPVTRAETHPHGTLHLFSMDLREGDYRQNVVVPLETGNQALGARLRLIEEAEKTLDLQYFLMKPDMAGAIVSAALIGAADRGVRVRLLLDDVFTTVKDRDLSLLDSHPNISVRIFNPSARPGPKALGFVTEFPRVNRRMHNKTFTADGAYSIVGGRNIADEYFEINHSAEFADYDMAIVGPAVAEIADTFDLFWNDKYAIPLALLRPPPSEAYLEDRRAELRSELGPAREIYRHAVEDPFFNKVSLGNGTAFKASIDVVTDLPDKLRQPVHGGTRILAEDLLSQIRDAKESVVILTPYFVPEDYGARLYRQLAERGVSVRIVTNSIASTNHTYTHAGYRRHRAGLLQSGVELFEVRSDSLQTLGVVEPESQMQVVLHSKMVVIDGERTYVGSLNMDPRSIKLNSEFGVFVHSKRFAEKNIAELDQAMGSFTYRLELNDNERLQWHYDGSVPRTFSRREPGATLGKLLVIGITAMLGVELQL